MLIIKAVVFLLGLCVSVQVVAALHGIIDLWYTIRTEYPRVIRNILIWAAITAVAAWILGDVYRPAFIRGVIAFMVFYPFVYIGNKIMIIRAARIIRMEDP